MSSWRRIWTALRSGAPKPEPVRKGRISQTALLTGRGHRHQQPHRLTPFDTHPVVKAEDMFAPSLPLKAQTDRGVPEMALDEAFFPDIANGMNFSEGIGFFGYPYLAELSQRPEYRKMVEVLAMDMTREWIKFTYTGKDGEDKSEKIAALEAEFKRLGVQTAFRRVAELDGFFGRGHIFIDLGKREGPELETQLLIDKRKIKKGCLKRLQVVEPMWTYPGFYSSTDPLAPSYYRPETWYVMAKKVHFTRLLTFVLRPVPDMLKPAYSFGGLSMSQMAKPYVDNWIRNRQSVSDLLHSFTVFVLTTDLGAILNGTDAEQLNSRADLFNASRDNTGLMIVNAGNGGADPGEKLDNVSAPLAGLNDLLSSSQEQMSAVAGIPLVKYLGVTPAGLNASSDGEVRVYYDSVHAAQERLFRAPLVTILEVAQLSLFGEIDPDIGVEFLPLWQLDEVQMAAARKSDADVDKAYVDAGILSPEEVREKLAADKESPWANLDVSDIPELPEQAGLTFGEEEADADQLGDANDEKLSPSKSTLNYHGLAIVVETPKGTIRRGGYNGKTWQAVMAADYGYIMGTWSAEGRQEEMDCFVGPDRESQVVYVIDQKDLATGQFDEHKCMLGYTSQTDAVEDYAASYDSAGHDRIMGISVVPLERFKSWMATGDLYQPLNPNATDVMKWDGRTQLSSTGV